MWVFFRCLMRPVVSLKLQRRLFSLLGRIPRTPPAILRGERIVNGVRCEWQHAGGYEDNVLLYLHGGAFVFGSPATHRVITAGLASRGQ